jgi:hypothetical protein
MAEYIPVGGTTTKGGRPVSYPRRDIVDAQSTVREPAVLRRQVARVLPGGRATRSPHGV